jgi:hypothetical protein
MTDYEQTFESFWKRILVKKGELDMDQVKRELHDFKVMMDNVSQVYCHITGNRMSKPNYDASVVISVYEEEVQKMIQESRAELMNELEEEGRLKP